jgi:hypothetical protein
MPLRPCTLLLQRLRLRVAAFHFPILFLIGYPSTLPVCPMSCSVGPWGHWGLLGPSRCKCPHNPVPDAMTCRKTTQRTNKTNNKHQKNNTKDGSPMAPTQWGFPMGPTQYHATPPDMPPNTAQHHPIPPHPTQHYPIYHPMQPNSHQNHPIQHNTTQYHPNIYSPSAHKYVPTPPNTIQ